MGKYISKGLLVLLLVMGMVLVPFAPKANAQVAGVVLNHCRDFARYTGAVWRPGVVNDPCVHNFEHFLNQARILSGKPRDWPLLAPEDGNYDGATAFAVYAFQKRNGLKPDGLAGYYTVREMDAVCASWVFPPFYFYSKSCTTRSDAI